MTAFYFVRDGQAHNFPTYLIAIIVLITPAFWRTIGDFWHHKSLLLVTVFLAWLAVSTFWSPDWNQKEIVSRFGDLALLLTFLAALSICYQHNNRFFHWLFVIFICVATITAALSFYEFVTANGIEVLTLTTQRLSGWGGRLDNEVLTGLAYATAAQLTIGMAITEPRRFKALLYWLAFICLFYVVVLTQSRGPLLALLFGIAGLLLVQYTKFRITHAIPVLLIVVAGVTTFLYSITKSELTPGDLAPAQLEERIVNENRHLDLLAADGRPKGIKAAYGNPRKDNIRAFGDGGLVLANGNDTSIGAVWPAFAIDPDAKYFISIRVKASRETDAGFFLRVEESDEPVIQESHLATHSHHSEGGTVEATRQVSGLIEKWGLTTDWQEFTIEYNPTSTAKWASVLVLNWHGMGNAELYVDELIVYRFDQKWMDVSPQRSNQAGRFLLAGIDPRDLIWTQALDNSLTTRPLFGAGIASSEGITARDGLTYDHAHSIYLSTLHYGGLVGLGLLLALIFSVNNDVKRLAPSRERTIAFALVIFGLAAFAMDGDRLLTKINHLWLGVWLPIGLAIALTRESFAEFGESRLA